MSDDKAMRLHVELVPRTTWGKNVRRVVSNETWKDLRRQIGIYDMPCAICKSRTPRGESLHLHEQWTYDDAAKVQKLTDLVALCRRCHEVKHIGRAWKVGDGPAAMEHLRKTNGWTACEANKYCDQMMEQWWTRSESQWSIDISFLERLVAPSRIHPEWLDRSTVRPSDPLEAREWALDVLNSDALVVDTETTGLAKNRRAEIIEVAIVDASGCTVLDTLIRPRYRMPKRTVRINGITGDAVINAPGFPDAFGDIRRILDGRRVVAYKSEFERTMFEKVCDMHDLERLDCRWECAMWAYYFYSGSSGRFPRLPNGTHRARADCLAIVDLLNEMAQGRGRYYGRSDLRSNE
jgi:DNA polymerase III epsilon subunit-like protein